SFVATRPAGPVTNSGPGAATIAQPYTLLDSDPMELQIRPLPNAGRLPGFSGAVGAFSVSAPELATNVFHVGDPVKLTVKVRGDGNLLRLVAPPPPRAHNWQVLRGTGDTVPPQIVIAQGFTIFNYTLIPL